MAVTAKQVKQQLKLQNVLEDGKKSTQYFSDVLSTATDDKLMALAQAIDSINLPTLEQAQKVVTYNLIEG